MSDKIKQELVEKASGWALAIFAYGTAVFYFAKHVLDLTGDDLDAYVATLSAGATLFAGFIAIYLFNDWKEQHKLTIISKDAKDVFNQVHLERAKIQQLNFILKEIDLNPKIIIENRSQIIQLSSELIEQNNISKKEIACFLNLSKKLEIYTTIDNYFKNISLYNQWLTETIKIGSSLSKDIFELKVRELMRSNQDSLDKLRELIFPK